MLRNFPPVLLLICGIILSFPSALYAQEKTVQVLAIDYPPFTGNQLVKKGIMFELLEHYAVQHFNIALRPHFVPPARAQRHINTDDWCLSFYPATENFTFIPLTDEIVKLSLVRPHQETDFSWQTLNEFAGKRVAIFRSNALKSVQLALTNAGLILEHIDHLAQGFDLLDAKRVDFVFADAYGIHYIETHNGTPGHYQLAQNSLLDAPMGVFLNNKCRSMVLADVTNQPPK